MSEPVFSFRPQSEHPWNPTSKTKLGRYHGSHWHGVPKGYYVIALYIDGPFKKLKRKYSEEDMIKMVLDQFNVPIVTGKRKKKEVYPYGRLKSFQYTFKKIKESKEIYIEALLLTDDKKNDKFWGEGFEWK